MTRRDIRPCLVFVAVLATLFLLHSYSQKKKTDSTMYGIVEPKASIKDNPPKDKHIYHNDNFKTGNPSAISQKHSASSGDDPTLDELESILKHRLHQASQEMKPLRLNPVCDTQASISNSCDNDTCLRLSISENPRERLAQLIEPTELRVTSQIKEDMRTEMTSKINKRYDIIIATAATDNHFNESQALLQSLHSTIFPKLKNFTLIYYSLDLNDGNRQLLEKACDCTVVDFPFHKFPPFVKKNIRCFTWKTAIVNAHINQANVLVWLDASIRFHDFKGFSTLVENARRRGVQIGDAQVRNPFRTDRGTFHFFGEEPCAHLPFTQAGSGNIFFSNDPLIKRAVLEPWMGCTLHQNCSCPKRAHGDEHKRNGEMDKKWREGKGQPVYGLVHRHDQSAINLILSKVFAQYFYWQLFSSVKLNITVCREGIPSNYLLNRSKLPKLPIV